MPVPAPMRVSGPVSSEFDLDDPHSPATKVKFKGRASTAAAATASPMVWHKKPPQAHPQKQNPKSYKEGNPWAWNPEIANLKLAYKQSFN